MTNVLQDSLPFMATPGSYPGPEHTWTGRGRSQTSSQHLRPLLPPPTPPITSAPVTQSFVLINRSRPGVPDRRLGASSGASCFPGTDQVWLYQKEPPPPTHAQHSCLLWREKREESPEKQACHRTGRKGETAPGMSCINPLNATWPGGGLSRHLDAEPPSNPLRTGWASRTPISKNTPLLELEKAPHPHPQQKQPPSSGAHRPHPEPQGHPLTCPVSKGSKHQGQGWPQEEGFLSRPLSPPPPISPGDTEVSGGQRIPGREGICLPFLSHPSLPATLAGVLLFPISR